jgi:restriction system protein
MSGETERGVRNSITMMGWVLKAVRALGGSARPQEVYEWVANTLHLSPEERAELTPSAGVPKYENQMAWARHHLVQAGLLDSSQHGVWTLTDKGREVGDLTLEQAREIHRDANKNAAAKRQLRPRIAPVIRKVTALSDEDSFQAAPDHRTGVIEILQALTPSGFEEFCQRLLREAGFQNVVVTGRSGDGGIDGMGMLRVNTLVSFKVLFQCKRYRETVGPGQVRDFRGAMMGRADKGIILTTGGFTADARREAVRDGVPPIELVDADKLVDMLEELEIGLLPVKAFRVNEDFFQSFGRMIGAGDNAAKG